MELDTDVLIVGAGLAGLGFAVQLVRKYGHRNFEIIEKSHHVGGTWLVNSYPGCGCDVYLPLAAVIKEESRPNHCRSRPITIHIHLSQTQIGLKSTRYNQKFSPTSKVLL